MTERYKKLLEDFDNFLMKFLCYVDVSERTVKAKDSNSVVSICGKLILTDFNPGLLIEAYLGQQALNDGRILNYWIQETNDNKFSVHAKVNDLIKCYGHTNWNSAYKLDTMIVKEYKYTATNFEDIEKNLILDIINLL